MNFKVENFVRLQKPGKLRSTEPNTELFLLFVNNIFIFCLVKCYLKFINYGVGRTDRAFTKIAFFELICKLPRYTHAAIMRFKVTLCAFLQPNTNIISVK